MRGAARQNFGSLGTVPFVTLWSLSHESWRVRSASVSRPPCRLRTRRARWLRSAFSCFPRGPSRRHAKRSDESSSRGWPPDASSSGRTAGIPDVIGDAGMVFPENDVVALRETIATALTDRALALDLRTRGRDR